MALAATRSDGDFEATRTTGATGREPFSDQVLSLAAMGGAVAGAFAGTVLGAEAGTTFPVACGTLGTMLGSGLTATGWCLLVRVWAALFAGGEAQHARPKVATSTSNTE